MAKTFAKYARYSSKIIEIVVKLDLQDGAYKTALIWAATNNSTDMGLALIRGGVNLDLQGGYNNTTALIWAARNNNRKLGLALISAGAKLDLQGGYNNRTALGCKEQQHRVGSCSHQ